MFIKTTFNSDLNHILNCVNKCDFGTKCFAKVEHFVLRLILDIPTQFSHDLFVSYNFGKKSEFTVSAECTNIFNARLYDNFKMQKPGRAFAIKFGYSFMK